MVVYCQGIYLKDNLKKMSRAFKKLIRYLNSTKKLSFIDFSSYGFEGAIRSLEITFHDDSYHPHYHVALVLAPDLKLEKKNKNIFSYDFVNNKNERLFSDFEIIIQKLWYMCFNDIYVSPTNFNKLEVGYSCILDKFYDDDYMELFKYMTKETDEKNNILTYDNFKTLFVATKGVKQIQGYGCLFKINDSKIDDEVDKVYDIIKYFLESEENPVFESHFISELLNLNDYTIISRKKIFQYLKNKTEN